MVYGSVYDSRLHNYCICLVFECSFFGNVLTLYDFMPFSINLYSYRTKLKYVSHQVVFD